MLVRLNMAELREKFTAAFRDVRTKRIQYYLDESSQVVPGKLTELEWKDYCPDVFRNIQEMNSVNHADYMMLLCANNILREVSLPGKAGRVFVLSTNDHIVIKTLKKSELKQSDISTNIPVGNLGCPSKLLFPYDEISIFCNPHIVWTSLRSLNGRSFHCVSTGCSSSTDTVDSRSSNSDTNSISSLLEFENTRLSSVICQVPDSGEFKFGSAMPARAVRKRMPETENAKEPESIKVVLYFAVVDIYQRYTMIKRFEHLYKSLHHDPKLISAVNCKDYSSRFQNYLEQIFLPENSDS
ncbi:hypothetical protein GH714_038562 [Hevea brasiliensis]|uniref:1-phosphatidylinositol-4-phosphate 5-kinase n=1 Tax=Hevea brasiliensis TaxID=3981 RepID=A0A6A6MN89_HEVBR|nr:hypothetical protein GH714_038562 [Hevea brasiliensis]